MLSEELILHYIPKVFKEYQVKEKSLLRVTRNADIDADALYDEDLDYREFMADLIKKKETFHLGADRTFQKTQRGQCETDLRTSGNKITVCIPQSGTAGSVLRLPDRGCSS